MPTRETTSLAETVRQCISEALAQGAERDAERITVSVKGSRAVLKGVVRSWAEHEDIEAAARASPGVSTVDNQVALLVKARPVYVPGARRAHDDSLSAPRVVERSNSSSTRRRAVGMIRGLAILAGLAGIWFFSTEPWGLGVAQLLMFTAPGALLGLGAGWMAHMSMRADWTWKSARHSALTGAAILPPVIGFFVALQGQSRPQSLLFGFVYAAWVALVAGAAVAIFRSTSDRIPRGPARRR